MSDNNSILQYLQNDDLVNVPEGCLSLPNVGSRSSLHNEEKIGLVPRAKEITIIFNDINWISHNIKVSGQLSVVMQHEYDHLQGVVYPARMKCKQNIFWNDYINFEISRSTFTNDEIERFKKSVANFRIQTEENAKKFGPQF